MKKTDKKLVWELSLVICCKVALIAAICIVFFGPETKISQTPETVSQGILSRTTDAINNNEGVRSCSQQN